MLHFRPLIAAALCFSTASTVAIAQEDKPDPAYASIALFTRALQLIRQDYVDESKIDYEKLTYAALRGMMESLDPHSAFMEPQNYKELQEGTNSRFDGLGVVVQVRDGNVVIVSPMEDSPSFKAGLLPGDQIVKINGKSTEKLDMDGVAKLLRGSPGTKITLTILRPATKEVKDYELTRDTIKVTSVKDARVLPTTLGGDFKIGYARITQFNEPTVAELSTALDKLEADGMQAFVLDLRFNPGGLLNSAIGVCGQFLPPNTQVASTEGRSASQNRTYFTPKGGKQRPNYPVAVLINNGSASASEIVSGALKDLKRAVIIGETTFGKGSVQSVIQLQNGTGVRLTTAKYYTPSRQVIHEVGITPTITATMTPEQERALLTQRREDVLPDDQKKEIAGFRDTQLERAVDVLKGVLAVTPRQQARPVKK